MPTIDFARVLRHLVLTMDRQGSHFDPCTFLLYLVLNPIPQGFSSSDLRKACTRLYATNLVICSSDTFCISSLFLFVTLHNPQIDDDGVFGAEASALR
jgi:hypothetical protein